MERISILSKASIVLCTLSGSGSEKLNKTRPFDYVIVDEACQCNELSNLIPLQYGASHMVLVGDPNQLPATMLSPDSAENNYSRSLFERFKECGIQE